MSDSNLLSKNQKWGLAAVFTAIVGAGTTYSSFQVISPGEVGVQIRAGKMIENDLQPGIHFTWPIYDRIYTFSKNTIISEVSGGAAGQNLNSKPNTKDRNHLTADFRFHYIVDNKSLNMALHAESIGADNGKSLNEKLANDSVNAVVGSQLAVETLQNPEQFLQSFVKNFMWRLEQNQVPIVPDTIELRQLQAGGLVTPVQMRINVATGEIVKMSLPATEAPAPGK